MPNSGSFTYWYLQIPNFLLLAMIVLLAVHVVLSLAMGGSSPVMRAVRALTHPVMAIIGAVTPRMVPRVGVMLCAIVWLAAARTMLFMAAMAMGMRM